jgi:hypothetical protein
MHETREIFALTRHSRNLAFCLPVVGSADANSPLGCCAIGRAHGVLRFQDHGCGSIRPQLIRDELIWDKAIFL